VRDLVGESHCLSFRDWPFERRDRAPDSTPIARYSGHLQLLADRAVARCGAAHRESPRLTPASSRRVRSPGVPWKYVPVDAVATFVHHRGPTTLPDRPPDTSKGDVVLCLHDAGGNGNVFSGVLDALAENHSPLAYDQPGHGRSGGLDSLGSVPAMAGHARALADALGVKRPVLFGDGLGAAVALEAALTDPVWPKAIVLCGGATAHADLPAEAVEQLRRVASGKARREFDTSGYAPETPREAYQRAFGEWLKTDPRATLGDRQAQQIWDAHGRLGAVACPVLVVVGEHEEPASRSAAQALAETLPQAKLVELAGAGRRGVSEQPATLGALVNAFLQEIRS
jgi:pimeloyl-ACP methyl ester carboxylesterase